MVEKVGWTRGEEEVRTVEHSDEEEDEVEVEKEAEVEDVVKGKFSVI